jgi:hypothetical protein
MEEQDNTDGVRILSLGMYTALHYPYYTVSKLMHLLDSIQLDGGGPGCFSQLVILDEMMGRIAHDKQLDRKNMYPADYFDLMGGVGFGA